jgi:hypothetical protein
MVSLLCSALVNMVAGSDFRMVSSPWTDADSATCFTFLEPRQIWIAADIDPRSARSIAVLAARRAWRCFTWKPSGLSAEANYHAIGKRLSLPM